MRLIRHAHLNSVSSSGYVATIGNFDGVHLGHQHVLDQVKSRAQALALPSLVMVFEPQPQEYFAELRQTVAPARLLSFREKFEALRQQHIDAMCCLKFDRHLSSLSAEDFVKQVLVDQLDIRHLVIGDDFRFGSDRSGDYRSLESLGGVYGFSVENSESKRSCQGERVSSTKIRQLLSEAHFDQVNEYLGRPYTIHGKVIYGRQLGRTLGFPTANVRIDRKELPLKGVYCVSFHTAGERYLGVANIGYKPTLQDVQASLEVHILSPMDDLYGEQVGVEFLHKLRDEQKFESLDDLKLQIERDVAGARAYFTNDSA